MMETIEYYTKHIDELIIRNVNVIEQETVIAYNRTEDLATIYTTDNTTLTKLKRLIKNGAYSIDKVTVSKDNTEKNSITSITVSFDKNLISLRTKERILSTEDAEKKSNAMKQYWINKKNNDNNKNEHNIS